MKKISIIHPTRGRKQIALATAHKWKRFADRPHNVEYIFSVDTTDTEAWSDRVEFIPQCYTMTGFDAKVFKNDNKSAIDAINKAAEIATGDLIIVVSDDFDCPEHWDRLLLREVANKEDFLLKTDDGLQKTLVTLPIMDRKYYERFGYVYHKDYGHMHADEEMTIVALMLGRYIKSDLCFPHNHYTTGKMQMDTINAKNNATWAHGQSTLDRRAKTNFGIENPLVKREDIVWR